MQYRRELVAFDKGLNIKVFVHSVLDVIPHWHQEYELLMILNGNVTLKRENKQVDLGPSDVVLVNSNELHSLSASDNNIVVAIQFQENLISDIYPEFNGVTFNCDSTAPGRWKASQLDEIRYHIAQIARAFTTQCKWFKLTMEKEAFEIIKLLLEVGIDKVDNDSQQFTIKARDLERLTRIIAQVEQNYASKIQLKDIAEHEYVSQFHLSRFFKEKMGISFMEYLFNYRLHKASVLLCESDRMIGEIAYNCGFNDLKVFYKKFKNKYHCTPTEFRGNYQQEYDSNHAIVCNYLTISHKKIFTSLYSYLDKYITHDEVSPIEETACDFNSIDIYQGDTTLMAKPWQKMMTFGCAHEILRKDVQLQITNTQKEHKYHYARFQGIFNRQMQILCANDVFNWDLVDQLIDFLLAHKFKPFFCLGYMPDEYATSNQTVAYWNGNVSPAKDINLWTHLCRCFMEHVVSKYGEDEVSAWRFEVWNEPDLEPVFWSGTQQQYHQLYLATYRTIKDVSPLIKVGGPSVSHALSSADKWLTKFVDFCLDNQLEPDFFSYHIYPEQWLQLETLANSKMCWRPMGENGTQELNSRIQQILTPLKTREYHISEWNLSACWGNPILDTVFSSSFIVYNAISMLDQVNSLGVWTFSDLFEERGPVLETFHGGFGLQTKEGLKKPSYHAISLLNELGTEILDISKHHIVTCSTKDHYQILCVNYVHFNQLYSQGDVSVIDKNNPYNVFVQGDSENTRFNFQIGNGTWKVTRTQLNRSSGSVFDNWKNMGGPNLLDEQDLNYLKHSSAPNRNVRQIDVLDNCISIDITLPPHGIELVTIKKNN